MAKKRKKTEVKASKEVANCDQLPMAVEQQLSEQEDIARLILN